MSSRGVAVIVVHGVADQQPGDTARALVELMVTATPPVGDEPVGGPHRVGYQSLATETFVLEVVPLQPKNAPARTGGEATPRGEDRSTVKASLQSFRSDFQRSGWHAPNTARGLREAMAATPIGPSGDRGLEATDYLLAKHRDNGAGREAYETQCIRMIRSEAGRSVSVTVYEMYWADLSRLSGALPRIVTELFTMVFRLSKLGRDTVDEACRSRGIDSTTGAAARLAWRLANGLQIGLDWLFANFLALLFALLLLLALVLVALGAASLMEDRSLLHRLVAATVAIPSLLLFAYRRRDATSQLAKTLPLLVSAACIGALALPVLRPWVSGLILIAAITVLYELGLRVADDRFPLVRTMGRLLWSVVVVLMLASSIREISGVRHLLDPQIFDVGWHAVLFAIEVVLLAIKWWWIVAGLLLVVWFISGWMASRSPGYVGRASIATGRLGLTLSLVTFLVATMAIWSLLTTAIDFSVRNVAYSPCIFAFDEAAVRQWGEPRDVAPAARSRPSAAAARTAPPLLNRCLWRTEASVESALSGPAPSASSAGFFLTDRYRSSTSGFSVLAVILLALVAFLTAMFLPSVLAEMKLLVGRGRDRAGKAVAAKKDDAAAAPAPRKDAARVRQLGRWLTAGFRRLDGVVFAIVLAGVVLGIVFVTVFAGAALFGPLAYLAQRLQAGATELSQALLKPLVLTSAGIVATLTLLGGLLSKYLPALRAPLDVALDVDNHFREFPRAAIPRARIFSRYAALLAHVAAQGHDRIVIVAHSQGTVISAELLRFLASRDGRAPGPDDRPRLGDLDMPDIGLLTLGCPLRQLYAARFPSLYRWVIERRWVGERHAYVIGPLAQDVGVRRWINAFCSGDYVGRWLWSDTPGRQADVDPDDGPDVGHPMIDTVDRATRFGRELAYDSFDPMPPVVAPFNSDRELEVCLGFGAHTHYLEPDQTDVAWLVDMLVAPESALSKHPRHAASVPAENQ